MALFRKIEFNKDDRAIVADFESLTGSGWNGSHRHVKTLRTRLLKLQRYRCVYCQAVIQGNEVGAREMDHILPKSPSVTLDPVKSRSDAFQDRWHTDGYPDFTYVAFNIALACKACNARKGGFDSRKDRASAVAGYPDETRYAWVHPHHCRYDEHINIIDMQLYQALTPSGLATIMVCGLDRVEVIEDKFLFRARADLEQAETAELAIGLAEAAVTTKQYGRAHALKALQERFAIDPAQAQRLTRLRDAVIGSGAAYPDVTALAKLQEALMISNDYLKRAMSRTSKPPAGPRPPRRKPQAT